MKKIKAVRKEFPAESFISKDYTGIDAPVRDEVVQMAESYSKELIDLRKKESVVHVDEIASGVAKFYEKVRKIIDWKDDNALRRGAIERILKRKLITKMMGFSLKDHEPKELARIITTELVRGGHLPNHEIPQSRVDIVAVALSKYLYFLDHIYNSSNAVNVKKTNNMSTFVMEIAACEIEEILTRPIKEYGIMNAMVRILDERITITPQTVLSREDKWDMISIAVERKLYHLDDNYITYQYLKRKYPSWQNPNLEQMKWFAENLGSIEENSKEYIDRKVIKKFEEVAEQSATIFMLLDDAVDGLKKNPESIKDSVEDRGKLMSIITDAYNKRHATLKRRLKNSAIFSTLSVFISNWATFYLFEVPLAHLFYEDFNMLSTIVDFLLPAMVMFLLIIFIKLPKEGNLAKVLAYTQNILYKDQEYDVYEIKIESKKTTAGRIFVNMFYFISTILAFAGIGYVFYVAQLPITSVIYDTFTIAITIYAAVVVRRDSRELYVGDDRDFKDFVFDVITVPIAKVGLFLSKKWKEYNVVSAFTNFLVELPFAAILDFIEDWSAFIKERKSELR